MPRELTRSSYTRASKESEACGCGTVTDVPRRVDVEVTRCTMCPFMIRYNDAVEVKQVVEDNVRQPDERTIHKGWYCLHPKRRDTNNIIATYKNVEVGPSHIVGLDSWLKHHHRGLFPNECPLTKPKVMAEQSGKRLINITT